MTPKTQFHLSRSRRSHDVPWLPLINRDVILRSAMVATVIGTVLTLINQADWIAGHDSLKIVPLILVFATPFAVVAVSQVVATRQAMIDAAEKNPILTTKNVIATPFSHGIPIRAAAIAMIIGTVTASITLTAKILQSGNLESLPLAPLGQAFALPLLFGIMSQAISYIRALHMVRSTAPSITTIRTRPDRHLTQGDLS